MSAEMIIGSVLAAIILLRWLKWLRGDGENEEFDWLILTLGVVAALTLAWRFLNPLGVYLTHRRKVAIALGCALTSHLCDVVADFIVSCVVVALKPVVLGR
jgi:hypothetical protein